MQANINYAVFVDTYVFKRLILVEQLLIEINLYIIRGPIVVELPAEPKESLLEQITGLTRLMNLNALVVVLLPLVLVSESYPDCVAAHGGLGEWIPPHAQIRLQDLCGLRLGFRPVKTDGRTCDVYLDAFLRI